MSGPPRNDTQMQRRGKFKTAICTSLLLLANVSAIATSPATDGSVSLRFQVYSPRSIDGLHFGRFDENGQLDGSTPLEFRWGGRSRTYDYSGPRRLTFFQQDSTEPYTRNPPTPLASIHIPEDLEMALLVFLPNPQRGASNPFLVYAVNDSEGSFPWGSIRLYNLTSSELQGSYEIADGHTPGGVRQIQPGINPAWVVDGEVKVRLAARFRDDFWHVVLNERFEVPSGERMLLLLFPPKPGARQMRFAQIRDYR